MLKRLVHWIQLSILIFLFSSSLYAQVPWSTTRNKWEVSVFFGLTELADQTFTTPIAGGGTQQVGLGFDTSPVAGLRITENLGQHFGAELEYALAAQDGTFTNLSPSISSLELDQKIHKIVYSVLFYPLERHHRYRPYGSVGVGASFFQVSSDSESVLLAQGTELRNRWKFAASYGAGLKIQLGRQWGVRLGFRDHITSVPDFGLPSTAQLINETATGPAFRPEGNFHHWQFTAGFMYTLRTR